jgi:hypothetical protein
MSGCDFPVMTQADVAALSDIERATARAANGCDAALLRVFSYRCWQRLPDGSIRPRLLTGQGGVCVPNHARHVPPVLRGNLCLFADAHSPAVLAASALAAYYCHLWRAARSGRSAVAGIRPRRVTANGLVIVRGRR